MRTAIVTASYRGDIERCRLLCESIDRHVKGQTRHLILVEDRDRPLFADLAGPRREIVCESELLPFWLRPFPDPIHLGRRRVWLSPVGLPLRGWHVQQLRRIAAAATIPEEIVLSCDSDVVFVKPFDVSSLAEGKAVRFHRRVGEDHAVVPQYRDDHRRWCEKAGALLGIDRPARTDVGYIATGIAWRTDTVRAMVRRIETVGGRSWVATLAGTRALSECTIYGRFVDEVEGRSDRHLPTAGSICRVYWTGAALGETQIAALVAGLGPGEVALGIQSFTDTSTELIRRVAALDRASPGYGGAGAASRA